MAAPPSKTLHSLSGQWKLNKSCSDDFSQVLALQGVNALVRKAATAASIHVKISQPDDQHIGMAQSITSGKIPGTTEEYTLDYEWRSNKDGFFGEVLGRSRWVTVDEARKLGVVGEGEGEWLEGGEGDGKLIHAEGKKEDEWEASHLWGFEVVDGERRHTRRVRVRNSKGEELRVRMVYDFVEE
ncbi:lccl domain-containing protein [Curvularia clavata]|uniref:Lccl domain-containing protein n=1 Tax=Curvularia clavata TaxID=95742 RepID=A0A9Q8Z1Y5_CURCL|nr:lccl domain-containing protein [Curvularia clavata]